MQHAVFVAEDDNCLWDRRPGMYVEFDGPAAVSFVGPTRVGSSRNTTFDLWAGTPIVAYTTDFHENKHACTIEVEVSTSDRIAGSILCGRLIGAHYSTGSGLQRIAGKNAPTISIAGTFEFTR